MTKRYAAEFNIAAVERDTGLSKDVLRVWERRYGFPVAERGAQGERLYSQAQVERLRYIKRMMDQGHRPGKLIAMEATVLAAPGLRREEETAREGPPELEAFIALLKRHDAAGCQQRMQQGLARAGLQQFVLDTLAPLTRLVGEAWETGRLQVFEEHLFTELTKRLLRQAIAALPPGHGPRILLTTASIEQHGLGLLMAEALFSLEGASCIPLGTQMPVLEIAQAARAHRADIVALSFSAAFPYRQAAALLKQLRLLLPPGTALWAGGDGLGRVGGIEGVRLLAGFEEAVSALREWRQA